MDENNNLNEFLIEDNNSLNQSFNILDVNNNNSNNSCFCIVVLIILIISFLYSEIYSLYSYINNFTYEMNKTSDIIFEQCIKYPSLLQIYLSIFYIFVITLLLFSVIIFYIPNDEYAQKFFASFMYFISYLLGPILTAFSVLGLLLYNKVFFICEKNDPSNMNFDYATFLFLLLSIFIGINILLGYNALDSFNLLTESIRFKEEGNYFLGKIFWKVTQMRRRSDNNEANNN